VGQATSLYGPAVCRKGKPSQRGTLELNWYFVVPA